MRLVLALAVGIDQHSAVECVTVPPWTLAGPWDAIHYRGARRGNDDLQCGLPEILYHKYLLQSKLNSKNMEELQQMSKEATTLQVKDIMRTRQSKWRCKKCKKERAVARVKISHNEQLEPWALCHLSTAMYHSQTSICMSSKTSLPIFLQLSNTYIDASKHVCTHMYE